jgi:hypothetical protein
MALCIPSLTHENLKELGVTALGHRLRLLDAIAARRADASGKAPSANGAGRGSNAGLRDGRMSHRTAAVTAILFGGETRRHGVVDASLPFALRLRALKTPRTPERRITPPFRSVGFAIWRMRLLAVVAHIIRPVQPRKDYLVKIAEGQSG